MSNATTVVAVLSEGIAVIGTHDDTLDSLSIAEGDGHLYVYADDDPDVCPAFRLRLRTG